MSMILSPYFWEWLNIWLCYFLKDLHNEIKMVALRSNGSTLNNFSHACLYNGNHAQQNVHDVAQSLQQTSLNMPQTAVAHHIRANQINLQPLNTVAIQLLPQHPPTAGQLKLDHTKHDHTKQDHVKSERQDYFKFGPSKHEPVKYDNAKTNVFNKHPTLKHEHFKYDHMKHDHNKHDQSSARYSSTKCMMPSHHFTIIAQARPLECYNLTGAAGGAYMPSTSGGAQPPVQATLRVQPTQPSAPPTPQQDMSKTSMAGHNYVSQNQTTQPRTQYTNFQYRPSQHTPRPATIPRQQQPFIPGGAASSTPVMYPILFQSPLSLQSYQQPRSNTPYPYQYLGYIPGYNTSSGHTPQYYYPSNSPQLSTPNPQTNTTGRSNPTTMVGPQGTTTTPTAPTASISHQQPPTHMHQPIPGIRNTLPKRSHRVPIINPVTQQDIFSEIESNDSYNDASNRQTPQPEATHNVIEEFTRRINEVANQHNDSATKWNYVTKNADATISSTSNNLQTQPNALLISNNNNNNNNNNSSNNKSEILTINESKNLGPDIAVETNETPIVSAISDSPVIVPKMPLNVKQFQKNSDQPLVIESNKSYTHNKQLKSKHVPHIENIETCSEDILIVAATNVGAGQETSVPTPLTACQQRNMHPNTQQAPAFNPTPSPAPQPQRIREPREKTNDRREEQNKTMETPIREFESATPASILNGPVPPLGISSVDSLSNAIKPPTSQSHHSVNAKPTNNLTTRKQSIPAPETIAIIEPTFDVVVNNEKCISEPVLTPTELLSASIEKVVKEQLQLVPETREVSSASEAQAKLTQSLSSVLRSSQTELMMKDINLNNKTTDPDTANGNNIESSKTEDDIKDDINQNEKSAKNPNNNIKLPTISNDDANEQVTDLCENGNKTDNIVIVDQEKTLPDDEDVETKQIPLDKAETQETMPVKFVPKYKYGEDQWSPINQHGKKSYGIGLLKQIKDDPMSKNRPVVSLLESCNVYRTTPMQESVHIPNVARPINDSLFPNFAKGSGMGSRNNAPREPKKDGRNVALPGRGGSMKMGAPSGGSSHKPVIHVRLHDDVKLNEVDSAWKPTRFRQENVDEEEVKTLELYKKFRGILNKLTPQKFDTLLDKIKTLDINNQKRLEGVIDLVFEKAIDEPNFSEAYAAMCNKLSKLKVPADNATKPDQCVNFRALIINKCQNQFETDKVDGHVVKIEKDLAECTDAGRKKELILMLAEEQRRLRMRSVGNVRFIGELYKLKMLTSKIMEYCMKHLIDKLEEEKLECLCKLLTTIGEQIENEVSGQLDNIIKKMQEIVDRKSNKISSRVRFMIQDVIELRKRKWVVKSVIDSQPKMMDQIQKEAEQQQRHIELMNASSGGGGFRREDGGRGKRGDGRRQNSNNSFNESQWKPPRTTNFPVDTSKLKAATQKNLNNIKLAPHNSAWNHGSNPKITTHNAGSSNSMISISQNKYSMLENVQADPTSLRGTRDMTSSYHSKGASIERSTFNSRADFTNDGSNSGSATVPRSNSGTRSASVILPNPAPSVEQPAAPSENVPAEPLPDERNCIKKLITSFMQHMVVESFVDDIDNQAFPVQYHVAVIKEIINITLDLAPKKFDLLAKSFEVFITKKKFSPENFLTGLQETLECSPDLFIDIPMLYENLGNLMAPHIAKKHITFADIHKHSENIISSNHGHMFLRAIFRNIKDTNVIKTRWQESSMQLKQWMPEDQIPKWMGDNNLEFLEDNSKVEMKLLQLMKADESYDLIKDWVKENIGKSSNEDWFMRSLMQAICEYALIGPDGREMQQINQNRMNKYASLIQEFGETKQSREASCLFGIQQLIRRREYPQGLALVIFQYLHGQYIISLDGFIEWEKSEKEPEGKAVMLKMLTSFFTNIKEADNEDSCSED